MVSQNQISQILCGVDFPIQLVVSGAIGAWLHCWGAGNGLSFTRAMEVTRVGAVPG